MAKVQTRIYQVTNKKSGEQYLIRAYNRAYVAYTVMQEDFEIRIPTQEELVAKTLTGVKVIDSLGTSSSV